MRDDLREEKETSMRRVVLVVPKQHVKTVKMALERAGKLDKSAKIVPETAVDEQSSAGEPSMRITTTIPSNEDESQDTDSEEDFKTKVVEDLRLTPQSSDISLSTSTLSTNTITPHQKNPLHTALQTALSSLPAHILSSLHLTPKSLLTSFPNNYSIYPPLLLLPHNTLTSPPWHTFLHTYPHTHPLSQSLWSHLASATHTSHIAVNAPILPRTTPTGAANILRSPLNLTPLYGNFGPAVSPNNPTHSDFATALWATSTQNGLHQTWAPLHTMFSRGNMREKTRVLKLPDIASNQTVVDMYAGIGYFAFSYKKAGAGKVVCFEMNGWSVEGLRRGVERNGWSYRIFTGDEVPRESEVLDADVDFLIFQTSNAHALRILTRLRKSVPPIRHINLGLLPDARSAWRDAAHLLDAREGGCVRVHENVGAGEIGERKREVEGAFRGYLDGSVRRVRVKVEHVERVKMYAPGVVHCVFDVRVSWEDLRG